jgi:hypothetical protein
MLERLVPCLAEFTAFAFSAIDMRAGPQTLNGVPFLVCRKPSVAGASLQVELLCIEWVHCHGPVSLIRC